MRDIKAEDIMIPDVATINADESVALAKLKMVRMGIGGLPVMKGRKIVGMTTHRDAILAGNKANGLRVRDIMTPKVRTISRKTSLKEITAIMKETGYQRLPVVENKKLVGIVTQSCIINAVAERL
ncbi:MAG: CBS domain-containing protein [Methanobacteriota archaeon]